jgi:hypothetical protein
MAADGIDHHPDRQRARTLAPRLISACASATRPALPKLVDARHEREQHATGPHSAARTSAQLRAQQPRRFSVRRSTAGRNGCEVSGARQARGSAVLFPGRQLILVYVERANRHRRRFHFEQLAIDPMGADRIGGPARSRSRR